MDSKVLVITATDVAEQALQRATQRYPLQANITREGAGLSSAQRELPA